jgi:hypothetical protein
MIAHLRWPMLLLLTCIAVMPLHGQSDSIRAITMVGCYVVRVGPGGGEPLRVAPSFRLDGVHPAVTPIMRRADSALTLQGISHRPVDSAVANGPWRQAFPGFWSPPPQRFLRNEWRVGAPDTLLVRWSDGFSSVDFTFRIDSDTLRGIVHVGSDQVGYDSTVAVRAVRKDCPTTH